MWRMLSERLQKMRRRGSVGTGGASGDCSDHTGSRFDGGAGTSAYERASAAAGAFLLLFVEEEGGRGWNRERLVEASHGCQKAVDSKRGRHLHVHTRTRRHAKNQTHHDRRRRLRAGPRLARDDDGNAAGRPPEWWEGRWQGCNGGSEGICKTRESSARRDQALRESSAARAETCAERVARSLRLATAIQGISSQCATICSTTRHSPAPPAAVPPALQRAGRGARQVLHPAAQTTRASTTAPATALATSSTCYRGADTVLHHTMRGRTRIEGALTGRLDRERERLLQVDFNSTRHDTICCCVCLSGLGLLEHKV